MRDYASNTGRACVTRRGFLVGGAGMLAAGTIGGRRHRRLPGCRASGWSCAISASGTDLRGLLFELRTSHGTLTGLEIELRRARHVVARHALHRLAHTERRVVLRDHGHTPRPGHYTLIVRHGPRTLVRRAVRVA